MPPNDSTEGASTEEGPTLAPLSDDNSASEVLLAPPCRLSESLVFAWLRRWYQQHGPDAWRRYALPHYITSNPRMASAYARMVVAWLHDLARDRATSGDASPDAVVTIVELGGGSGRFAHLFAPRLAERVARCGPPGARVRYLLTDFVDQTLAAWRANPALAPLIAQGLLEVARFDADAEAAFTAFPGGAPVPAGGPLIVIANYVFDSLPCDAFQVQGGHLLDRLARVESATGGADPAHQVGVPDTVDVRYESRALGGPAYGDPEFDGILDGSRQRLSHASLLFPIGALGMLSRLARLSDGRMLLLTADKGYHHEAAVEDRGDPVLTRHGGPVSFAVNYHAIGEWFRGRGGTALLTAHAPVNIDVAAFALGPPVPHTRIAFEDALEQGTPDDVYLVRAAVIPAGQPALDPPGVREVLAMSRLGGHDPHVLGEWAKALARLAQDMKSAEVDELVAEAERAWPNYMPIGEPYDLPFTIATLFHVLQRDDAAVRWYRRSLVAAGPDRATFYNIAHSLERMGRTDEALAAVTEALAIDPGFAKARALRARLEAERPTTA